MVSTGISRMKVQMEMGHRNLVMLSLIEAGSITTGNMLNVEISKGIS